VAQSWETLGSKNKCIYLKPSWSKQRKVAAVYLYLEAQWTNAFRKWRVLLATNDLSVCQACSKPFDVKPQKIGTHQSSPTW
jgi:hypothetical protein